MNNSAKNNTFGGAWKILAIVVICGYTLSTVLAFDSKVLPSQASTPAANTPSLQKEIETDVALSAKKVWTSILDFMQGGLDTSETSSAEPKSDATSKAQKPEVPLVKPLLPQSESQILPAFSDISDDENKASIEILASIGLIKGGEQGKFFPHNYVRCSDFTRVLVDLYRHLL
ncbi:MAG: hypothetical protein Q4B28_04435 [bacterium]|nr:hypothetical protein [bacterium]